MRRLALMMVAAELVACGSQEKRRSPTGLESLGLTSVAPDLAIPGTTLMVEGSSFLDAPLGVSWLRLDGTYAGNPIGLEVPAKFVDYEHLQVPIDAGVIGNMGAPSGKFEGTATVVVDYTPDATRHLSASLDTTLTIAQKLTPSLDTIQDTGGIFVNDPIPVTGHGFLLGGDEGTTYAVAEGCFVPAADSTQTCKPVGPVTVPVTSGDAFDRTKGTFAFSPRIAGIFAGSFEGKIKLQNTHADGMITESSELPVQYDLLETTIDHVGDGGSLGQYIDVKGGGFVGAEDDGDALTILQVAGQYVADDAVMGVPVDALYLVPDFVSGQLVRYVIDEQDDLGQKLAPLGGVRYASGTFDGTIQPIVQFGNDELDGPTTPLTFRIEPVKQVAWVKFNETYVESLRLYGLRALVSLIRARIFEVLARDYASLNVEFRPDPPDDFKLYAEIEISGPDPNGVGLLGYDNTHGKDRNNERLYDHIGGVNALTQEDGFQGYGGVFIESMFTFSKHPPSGLVGLSPEVGNVLFDQIFDPFRPDRGGKPVTSDDLAGGDLPKLTDAGGCPTTERRLQIACAVWVLGSTVGSTVSHEFGHSLGLADPLGMNFHNLGDGVNRLMDKGGARPFEERSELQGKGPSRFCTQAYDYLRQILPSGDPETTIERPSC